MEAAHVRDEIFHCERSEEEQRSSLMVVGPRVTAGGSGGIGRSVSIGSNQKLAVTDRRTRQAPMRAANEAAIG
jgi:hypothetical protein